MNGDHLYYTIFGWAFIAPVAIVLGCGGESIITPSGPSEDAARDGAPSLDAGSGPDMAIMADRDVPEGSADGSPQPDDGELGDANRFDGRETSTFDAPVGDASACYRGAPGAVDAGDNVCALSMPLQGGITNLPRISGCGSSGVSSLDLDWVTMPTDRWTVTLHLPTMIADRTGPIPIDSIEITKQLDDGGSYGWKTPPGACSVTITKNICAPASIFDHRRVLTGEGTCSQPAAPEPGNPGTPAVIGDFSFTGFTD
jgi:hypothetical protein